MLSSREMRIISGAGVIWWRAGRKYVGEVLDYIPPGFPLPSPREGTDVKTLRHPSIPLGTPNKDVHIYTSRSKDPRYLIRVFPKNDWTRKPLFYAPRKVSIDASNPGCVRSPASASPYATSPRPAASPRGSSTRCRTGPGASASRGPRRSGNQRRDHE